MLRKKIILRALLLMTLIFSIFLVQKPKEVRADATQQSIEQVVSVSLKDLNSAKSVKKAVYSPDGNYLGTLTITPDTSENTSNPLLRAANGTYNVNFIGVSCNVGYKITVRSNKITNAYGFWAIYIGWHATKSSLTHSGTRSVLRGEFYLGTKWIFGGTYHLDAWISGGKVYSKIYIP